MIDEDAAQDQAQNYIDLYLRAETWAIPELQNTIIDRLRARTTCALGWFPRTVIKKIYAGTTAGYTLRCYVVDSFISKSYFWNDDFEKGGRAAQLKLQLDYGNQVFVLECYEAIFKAAAKSKIRNPDKRVGCAYHKHKGGKKCKR